MLNDHDYSRWLLTRPPAVQELAKKLGFKPGQRLTIDGDTVYFVGFSEYDDRSVGVFVTPLDPAIDYDLAIARKATLCDSCVQKLLLEK